VFLVRAVSGRSSTTLRQVIPQGVVDGSRVREGGAQVGVNDHNIAALPIALRVLATLARSDQLRRVLGPQVVIFIAFHRLFALAESEHGLR